VWLFCKCDAEQRIADLKQERDQAEDGYMAIVQAKGAAETAMREMQKAMTDEGVADIARAVTTQIADIYASGGRNVKQRDIAVHAAVAEAVRKAARGESHWNERHLAAKEYA
jgi:ABC-type transporter MlaC component